MFRPNPISGRKILIFTNGSLGDLIPYLQFASGPEFEASHVTVATNPYYRSLVESYGFAFLPVGQKIDPLYPPDELNVHSKAHSPKKIREMMREHFTAEMKVLESEICRFDYLVSGSVSFSLPILAEQYRIPWSSGVLQPASLDSWNTATLYAPVAKVLGINLFAISACYLLKPIARWYVRHFLHYAQKERARRNLSTSCHPLYESGRSPSDNFLLYPEWFAPLPARSKYPFRSLGFPNERLSVSLPSRVEEFLSRGQPPVVFCLGSLAWSHSHKLLRLAKAACQLAQVRGVFVTGEQLFSELSAEENEDFLVAPYLDYAPLFKKARAIVSSAGIGTIAKIIAAKRPALLLPFGIDQPDNAYRAKKLGLAEVASFDRLTVSKLVNFVTKGASSD